MTPWLNQVRRPEDQESDRWPDRAVCPESKPGNLSWYLMSGQPRTQTRKRFVLFYEWSAKNPNPETFRGILWLGEAILPSNHHKALDRCIQLPPVERSALRTGVELRANLQSISQKCHLFKVASVGELTKGSIHLPLGCLQGGNPNPEARNWKAEILHSNPRS